MKILTALMLALALSAASTGSPTVAAGPEPGAPKTPNTVVAQATSQQPGTTAPATRRPAKRRLTERQSFNVARFVNTCEAYRLFLKDHPAGEFANQARRSIAQKCRSKRAGEAPSEPASTPGGSGAAANSSTGASDRAGRPARTKSDRRKSERARKKPSAVRKKRVVKPKATVKPARRSRVKRCRLETNWECIRRGGQIEFGACNRERVCE